MLRILVISLSLILNSIYPAYANFRIEDISIAVDKFDISSAITSGGGERGPAMAVLSEGSVLLGGGDRGGSVYLWNESSKNLENLGDLITARERIRDSRFAITDIAVLNENKKRATLLVSFPALNKGNCVQVRVYRAIFDKEKRKITKKENWFTSSPCVPISAVQHAAGRLAVIDPKNSYLTIGDLGYESIDNRSKRGDLGSVFKISRSKIEKISSGHRNQQGIVLLKDKTLLTSEHGPRGGDEINVIQMGVDYGWPFVTYGSPYSSGDYVIPGATGTHKGFKEPIKVWTPSIAPTELIQLPSQGFGKFSSGLAMGSLREESIFFMQYEKGKILETVKVPVGSRIRDLELLPDQRIIASTDEGKLLIFKSSPLN
jgi:glucose/arabinose dehydrogenase